MELWTKDNPGQPSCDECKKKVDAVVQLGVHPDGGDNPHSFDLCPACLNRARVALMEGGCDV